MTDRRIRRTADRVLLGAVAVALVTNGLDFGGPIRLLAVLICVAFLPGATVLSRLPVDDPLSWLGLSVALSLAFGALLSSAMVWTGLWYPRVIFGLVFAVCAALIALDLRAVTTQSGTDR